LELARAYERVAEIQRDLGDAAGAVRYYRRAQELARSFSEANPNHAEAKRRLEQIRRILAQPADR
jgi:hypothetical protein